MKEQFSDMFIGLGCLQGMRHIKLQADAKTVNQAPRRVTIALKEKTEKELKQMEQIGVLIEVDNK